VDKHSTGGVGDKVSLVLAPLVAACGIVVPMMSGRGLGHTGGTLDKLESIPGFKVNLSPSAYRAQVEKIGLSLIGQTAKLAPADKKLYALRDVTATVECIPLIAASIMSKKLSEGLQGLVLDVKMGSGAFMTDPKKSQELAETMIRLGEDRGCPTVALLTAMDRPLGRACGNALEVEESINELKGEGPEDLHQITIAQGVEMLLLGRKLAPSARQRQALAAELEECISSGRAAQRFAEIIEAQGGNPAVVDDPGILPQASIVEVHEAPRAGTVLRVEPRAIGKAVVQMGGGRQKVDDVVDPSVGFVISARPGQKVAKGEPLASIYASSAEGLAIARATLAQCIEIGDGKPDVMPLIAARVTMKGIETL
jgi:pyrimidine-nucleoside phosphorylase